MSEISPDATDARRIAEVERDRVRFEEDALALADQVYRVARRMVNSREEAEDLVQDTYARAFRAWQQYQAGTISGPGCCASSRTSTSIVDGRRSARPIRSRLKRATTSSTTSLKRRSPRRTPTRSASSSDFRRTWWLRRSPKCHMTSVTRSSSSISASSRTPMRPKSSIFPWEQ